MKTKNLVLIILAVFLISLLVVVFFLTQAKTIFLGRATQSQYSLANSYVFASPLSAKTVSEKIRVTVFLLDDKGKGVQGKKISLSSEPVNLNFIEVQANSDELGQAVIDVTSPSAGQYVISAQVEGKNFPQTVTIRFQ